MNTSKGFDWPIIPYLKTKKKERYEYELFGRFLSGMVMPNIGAFIAWGLITALFIKDEFWKKKNLTKF
ncbi:MAG: hypothetical protein MSG78_05280 [Clostridiales bacterium]|nr:hypothetical protein [Clostridiales bacterium]